MRYQNLIKYIKFKYSLYQIISDYNKFLKLMKMCLINYLTFNYLFNYMFNNNLKFIIFILFY